MGIFNFMSKKKKDTIYNSDIFNDEKKQEENFFDRPLVREFINKYNVRTKEGIREIPLTETSKYTIPFEIKSKDFPENILTEVANEYAKEKNYDLAIECLKKANELYNSNKIFAYGRSSYERLVEVLILAGRFDEAKKEHKKLDKEIGTRVDEIRENLSEFSRDKKVNIEIIEEKNKEIYYWLLENKKDIAPKTFEDFENMRNKDTANYKKIVKELEKEKIDLEKVKFWY